MRGRKNFKLRSVSRSKTSKPSRQERFSLPSDEERSSSIKSRRSEDQEDYMSSKRTSRPLDRTPSIHRNEDQEDYMSSERTSRPLDRTPSIHRNEDQEDYRSSERTSRPLERSPSIHRSEHRDNFKTPERVSRPLERSPSIHRSEHRDDFKTPERVSRRSEDLVSERCSHPPSIRRSERSPSIRSERSLSIRRSSERSPGHSMTADFDALSRTVMMLVEKVQDLTDKQAGTRNERGGGNKRTSLSPEPVSGYRKRIQLEEMTNEQYILFHNDVVAVLKGLDETLQLDHTKTWTEIQQNVSRKTMKEIDKVMNVKFDYTETELRWVLQQLHRHRRDNWLIQQNPDKAKADRKRKGINSRRGDKKERRQKGLLHMFNTDDSSYSDYKPASLTSKEFKEDCEFLMNEGDYHSDEISETDDELCDKELNDHTRPKNKKENDRHVLHVYDKKWRSSRVRSLLHAADKVGESISHVKVIRRRWYDNNKWSDNSKPPKNAPEWTISQSYNPNDDNDDNGQE